MKSLNLKTGYLCNNNCIFCAQADNKPLGNPPTEDLRNAILNAASTCEKIIFTGGEPTVRDDLLCLIEFAKSLGFKRLQLQSNVRKLTSLNYCRDLIAAGINEFAPSLHGHLPEIHDLHTERQGSFIETVNALNNLSQLGQCVITNTVITSHNYRYLPLISEFLISHNVEQVQFAFVHAVGNGKINDDAITPRLTDVLPFIFSALRVALENNVRCMAESIPLCLMKDYKIYCSEQFIPSIEIRDTHYVDSNFENTRRNKFKLKPLKCESCMLFSSCEGPWQEYIYKYGDSELMPIAAKDKFTGSRNREDKV